MHESFELDRKLRWELLLRRKDWRFLTSCWFLLFFLSFALRIGHRGMLLRHLRRQPFSCRSVRSAPSHWFPLVCLGSLARRHDRGLLNMTDDLKGDYFPLHGTKSYAAKPNGMTEEKEEELRSAGNLFQEPDSTLLLASGMGRHWLDGRGVFHNDATNLFVWVGRGGPPSHSVYAG